MARRLEQLQADAAGRAASDAVKQMQGQLAFAFADIPDGEKQTADAAQNDLAKAQKQLAQRLRQAEADLARQQMNQLQQALHGWHDRQAEILAETARVDHARADAQPPASNPPAAARGLAQNQRALENEIRQHAGKLTAAEVFRLALAQAAGDMARAAENLDRGETGATSQQAEQGAVAALARLIAALEPAKPKPNPDEAAQDNAQGGGGQQQSKRSIASLAELKLLKLMQEDLNARWQILRESKPTPQSAAQIAELAAEQGRLAELAQKMSQPVEADPAEDSPGEQQPGAETPEPLPKGPLDRKENEI